MRGHTRLSHTWQRDVKSSKHLVNYATTHLVVPTSLHFKPSISRNSKSTACMTTTKTLWYTLACCLQSFFTPNSSCLLRDPAAKRSRLKICQIFDGWMRPQWGRHIFSGKGLIPTMPLHPLKLVHDLPRPILTLLDLI